MIFTSRAPIVGKARIRHQRNSPTLAYSRCPQFEHLNRRSLAASKKPEGRTASKRFVVEPPEDARQVLKRFGDLLKKHRLAARMSREELADRARLSVKTISALEQGSRQKPYAETIAALAGALELSADARGELERAALRVTTHEQPDASARNNLPSQLTSFVDRVTVVAEIKELLQSHRLLTLVGTGGAGKTRSSIKVGAEMLAVFDDGVWLTELAPISDPSIVASALARALNVQASPTRPILDTLLTYLKHKHVLLILDNCEHVIDEARHVVAAILQGCPDVRILATSRESLGIAGEQVYRIPSLAVPSASELLSPQELSAYGAMELFADRAVHAENRFTLSVKTAPYVAEICRRLDGIPLAIELAAVRVKVLSPEQLAQKLDERFRLLTAGDRSALPRHRTMRALIDWSYDLLTDDERRLFRKLSIFAGDFTLELAGAVCIDETIDDIAMLDLLSSLVDKSLVQTEQLESSTRYRLLETTRQYARERLTEAGEYDRVAQAHANAYLALAEELDLEWETMPEREMLARGERDLGNFRAALHWALGLRNDVLLGQRLAGALFRTLRYLSPAEGARWLEIARELVDTETPAQVVAALDYAEAWRASALGQHAVSRAEAERALAYWIEAGDSLQIARAQFMLGQKLVLVGETEHGETLLGQALAGARATAMPRTEGWALQSLARARGAVGDMTRARALFAEALALFRAIGADRSAAITSATFAEAEFQVGDVATALSLVRASIDAFRALNETVSSALALNNMSAYLTALGRYDEARVSGRAALTAARDTQNKAAVLWVLQHLAAVAALRSTDDDRLRATRLLGYVEARLADLELERGYTERQEYERMVAALRDTLGEDQVAKLMAEGHAWSADQAVAEAMLI